MTIQHRRKRLILLEENIPERILPRRFGSYLSVAHSFLSGGDFSRWGSSCYFSLSCWSGLVGWSGLLDKPVSSEVDRQRSFTVCASRCGVRQLLTEMSHVQLTTFHASWRMVAVILIVTVFLVSVILRNEGPGFLKFQFNQHLRSLVELKLFLLLCRRAVPELTES